MSVMCFLFNFAPADFEFFHFSFNRSSPIFFGRPSFLFPSGVHLRTNLVKSSTILLRTWPINLQVGSPCCCIILCSWRSCHNNSMEYSFLFKLFSNGGKLIICSKAMDHLINKSGFDGIAEIIDDKGGGI